MFHTFTVMCRNCSNGKPWDIQTLMFRGVYNQTEMTTLGGPKIIKRIKLISMSMPKYYVTRSSITWTQIWFNFVVLLLFCGNVMLKFLHTSLGPWKHHIPVSLYFMGAIETSDTVHQFGKLWISGVNEFVYTPFRNQNTISIDTTICILLY